MKFINQSYEQAYTKSSNDNTCKIKQNNNKKSMSIAIETAKCLALHHISTSIQKHYTNMGSNEQLMPVQCFVAYAFFFLPFLVEIWCSAKHFAVSIAALLFCFYFACIIIATFSVCLSIIHTFISQSCTNTNLIKIMHSNIKT
jgi:cation transport ATPase